MKRRLLLLGLLLLAAAHFVYWYLPRERAVTPPPPAADGAPLQGLAAGAYDLCLWIPYPHQNLGVLAASVADLPEVIAAAVRLNRGAPPADPRGGERSREPQELPAFGPFEIPPADEIVACTDLAGGRLRIVARIYPVLSLIAKAAGHLAGNPWLAGGEAGRMRVRWDGRLWSVTAGPDRRPPPPAVASSLGTAQQGAAAPAARPLSAAASLGAASPPDLAQPSAFPPSLAVLRWAGARAEIPAGWYALTREGSDLVLSWLPPAGTAARGAAGASAAAAPRPPAALAPAVTGTALLAAVGPDWRGALPFGKSAGAQQAPRYAPESAGFDPTRPMWTDSQAAAPAAPPPVTAEPAELAPSADSAGSAHPSGPASPPGPLPPAALALFESGSSRLTSLGNLPGLAVFNVAAAPGKERWGLPAAGIFRLAAGRLPAADRAGWHILALDTASLRQAEAIAPRLAALVPPDRAAAPSAEPGLSLGLWLDPRATLRIVTRLRTFIEAFPLASRPEVQLWRDWETVLDPLGHCDHAVLTATAAPPAMRLLLQGCTTVLPHPEEPPNEAAR